MKNIKCKYGKYCELNKECALCDLKNHKKANNNIIKQIKMDAINRNRKIVEVESTK